MPRFIQIKLLVTDSVSNKAWAENLQFPPFKSMHISRKILDLCSKRSIF